MGSSSRALDVISRFSPVSSRGALQESIHRCMMVAFGKYSIELDDIQAAYERNKVFKALFPFTIIIIATSTFSRVRIFILPC